MDKWRYEPATDLGLPESERLRSTRRESGLAGVLAQHAWWALVRAYFATCQRVTMTGRENVPAELPFVMVANHSSHLDALLLARALPVKLRSSVFSIAAGDTFFEKPMMAVFAAGAMNALPLWRKKAGHHAIDDLRQRLVSQRCGYILFPEGTRSRTGEMGKFRAGVGMLVAGTSVPVLPCRISGAFEALPAGAKFPRRSRLEVRIGKPVVFADLPNEREGWETVAQALEQAVRTL